MISSESPIVRFRDVSRHYGSVVAVDAVSFDIARGEFLTLLGPSGSGKTTSLMMLAGFETPSSGHIEMEGKHIEALPPHKRGIGVVFQNYALFPHMTVAENLAFPLSVRGVAKAEIEGQVAAALAMVHLADKGARKPAQLSGGQQQRIALARALIFKPRLIVLDEPLGALDKNLREQMQLELRNLHRELGVTMVFVTHDQSEALTMSDRVAVFNHGRIEQIDSPSRLYEEPATPFVASFIGENNLLEGRLEAVAGEKGKVRFANGALAEARMATQLEPGAAVKLEIRPENVALTRARGEGSFPARVDQVIYLGDTHRVMAQVDGVGPLTIRIGGVKSGPPPKPSSEVFIHMPAKACRVLPA